jgi:hypothetical protein
VQRQGRAALDMTNPWDGEPDRLEFEAEGLPCVMRRGFGDAWCGYVGISGDHPLFGLPRNALIKLPSSWFERRRGWQGTGPIDVFLHAASDRPRDEFEIALAFEVHGGITWSSDHPGGEKPDGRWWFGFDCAHAGDLQPQRLDDGGLIDLMIEQMPEEARATMRKVMQKAHDGVYRDQQYVVSECQSLAAQLIAVVPVLAKVGATERTR